jgi:hypothetical protein
VATIPNRSDVISMTAEKMYSDRILNNSHRGDVVEMIVLSALGSNWRLVSLGWHPWDLQYGSGESRVRIQVKQCAALQLWGPTKCLQLNFGWKKKAADYFSRDNPEEDIETNGWFCDIFVFGLHLETDKNRADQVDPAQWKFLVVPVIELKHGLNSMVLSKALKRWEPVSWEQLAESVEQAVRKNSGLTKSISCGPMPLLSGL